MTLTELEKEIQDEANALKIKGVEQLMALVESITAKYPDCQNFSMEWTIDEDSRVINIKLGEPKE